MGVSACHWILRSHSAKSWVVFALRCYLKTTGPRHLNKRWEIQLVTRKVSFGRPAPWKHVDQQNISIWEFVSCVSLLFHKWNDLDMIVILLCIYFVAGFSWGSMIHRWGPQPFHHQETFVLLFGLFPSHASHSLKHFSLPSKLQLLSENYCISQGLLTPAT